MLVLQIDAIEDCDFILNKKPTLKPTQKSTQNPTQNPTKKPTQKTGSHDDLQFKLQFI